MNDFSELKASCPGLAAAIADAVAPDTLAERPLATIAKLELLGSISSDVYSHLRTQGTRRRHADRPA
jgi:hypothetical protein